MYSKIDPKSIPHRMKIVALVITFLLALFVSFGFVVDVTIILIALARLG